MKNLGSVIFVLLFTTLGYAQNKSLGVGTTTPNANAALHVESPTNNQGFIMPRLTTAQRTAMSGLLGAGDEGVMVYDTDLSAIQIWSGSAWSGLAKLQYPYVDTVTTLPANSNALRIVYNSTDAGNFGVAHFENMNPNSGFTPLFARTNSATNGAADLVVNNPANTNDALGVTTNALNGRGGSFSLNNAGSFNHALYAQSNGDSTGSAVHGNNIGNGFGVFGKSAGSKFASAAVYGEHVGTGDAAGAFRISNASNNYSGLYGETNGGGPAIYGQNIGTGRAGNFVINNPASTAQALRVFTNGKGQVANFTQTDSTSTAAAVFVNSVGGNGVFTNHGGDTGYAGIFQNVNTSNNNPALYAEAVGTAASVWALKSTDAIAGDALLAENWIGTGSAATFSLTDAANTSAAVNISTAGTGNAITANAPIQATQFIGDGSLLTNVGGLALPLTDTLTNSDLATDFDALNITYTGDSSRTLLNLNFANAGNTQIANPFRLTHAGQGAAFFVTQSGTLGTGGVIQLTNAASPSQAFRASTAGTGQAGNFRITNATSTAISLYTETAGSGPALLARNNGVTDGFAGLFSNDSTSNNFPAIQAGTQGTGPGVRVIQDATSQGGGMDIYMNNVTSTVPGFQVDNQGLGNAGVFNIYNASNTNTALDAYTNGLGAAGNFNIDNAANSISAINANTNGTGNAGYFAIDNATSGGSGVYATTNGTGSAIQGVTSTGFTAVYGRREGATNGHAGQFEISDAGNTFPALQVSTVGTGSGGTFVVNNAASTSTAVFGQSNGALLSAGVFGENIGNGFGVFGKANGSALGSAAVYGEQTGTGDAAGAFRINNAANTSNAVYGETNGTATAINANQLGTGRGMIAQINNVGNTQSALLAQTNGTGPAIAANQSNGGFALDIVAGGMKLNVLDVGTPGTVDTKASVYNFTANGTYVMGTTGRVNGEIVYVTCEADVTVDLVGDGSLVVNLFAFQTATLFYVNGTWRSEGAVAP